LLHDDHKDIFWFLFLLLLFWKEAGYAFVENKLRTTKNQHKESRPEQAGIFVFKTSPTPPKGGAIESEKWSTNNRENEGNR
jgi:hypothetical protein